MILAWASPFKYLSFSVRAVVIVKAYYCKAGGSFPECLMFRILCRDESVVWLSLFA